MRETSIGLLVRLEGNLVSRRQTKRVRVLTCIREATCDELTLMVKVSTLELLQERARLIAAPRFIAARMTSSRAKYHQEYRDDWYN